MDDARKGIIPSTVDEARNTPSEKGSLRAFGSKLHAKTILFNRRRARNHTRAGRAPATATVAGARPTPFRKGEPDVVHRPKSRTRRASGIVFGALRRPRDRGRREAKSTTTSTTSSGPQRPPPPSPPPPAPRASPPCTTPMAVARGRWEASARDSNPTRSQRGQERVGPSGRGTSAASHGFRRYDIDDASGSSSVPRGSSCGARSGPSRRSARSPRSVSRRRRLGISAGATDGTSRREHRGGREGRPARRIDRTGASPTALRPPPPVTTSNLRSIAGAALWKSGTSRGPRLARRSEQGRRTACPRPIAVPPPVNRLRTRTPSACRSRDVESAWGLPEMPRTIAGVRAPSFTTAQFPSLGGGAEERLLEPELAEDARPAVRTTRTSFGGGRHRGPSASRGAPVAESARGVE